MLPGNCHTYWGRRIYVEEIKILMKNKSNLSAKQKDLVSLENEIKI